MFKVKLQKISLILFLVSMFQNNDAFSNSVEFKAFLSPAGNFVTKTNKVTGIVKKVGDTYVAENIIVDAASLESGGIPLRDEHMKNEDRLDVKKFPHIILVRAEGKNGKGSGRIKVKGVEVDIPKKPEVSDDPVYEIKDGKLIAQFNLLLDKFPLKKLKHMGIGVKNEIKVRAEIDIEKTK